MLGRDVGGLELGNERFLPMPRTIIRPHTRRLPFNFAPVVLRHSDLASTSHHYHQMRHAQPSRRRRDRWRGFRFRRRLVARVVRFIVRPSHAPSHSGMRGVHAPGLGSLLAVVAQSGARGPGGTGRELGGAGVDGVFGGRLPRWIASGPGSPAGLGRQHAASDSWPSRRGSGAGGSGRGCRGRGEGTLLWSVSRRAGAVAAVHGGVRGTAT